MVRSFARRSFPVIAWAYVAAIAFQVFFAGLYVFAGARNIELHRNGAHVVGAAMLLLLVTAFLGRIDRAEKRLVFLSIGLLIVQGMLVHVHQWFNMPIVAAFHPVNAMLMTWVAITLARRARPYWTPIARTAPPAVSAEGSPVAA